MSEKTLSVSSHYSAYLKITFLFLNQNICCGCSKEPSLPKHMLWALQRTVSLRRFFGVPTACFEHSQKMFKLMDKKIMAILHTNCMYFIFQELRIHYMGLVARKPVFGVSEKETLKPVSSALEASWKIEMLLVASLYMILSKTQITKAWIRLCVGAGWSAPLLFANPRKLVFSCRGPYEDGTILTYD